MNNYTQPIKILVTTTDSHAQNLCAEIQKSGHTPIHMPLFDIQRIDHLNESVISLLDEQDWIIFVSRASTDNLKYFPTKPSYAAIGKSTAQALLAKNIPKVTYNQNDWTSEGLLSLREFADVAGKKITVVKGRGGRTLLLEELQHRGAEVSSLIVYERILLEKNIKLDLNVDIIVTASAQALEKLFEDYGAEILSTPVIVVSNRMELKAQALGYKKIICAENASTEAIMSCMKIYPGHQIN